MKKEINIMLGGLKPKNLVSGQWCGVDGGAKYLVDKDITPIVSCGDFDSVSEMDKEKIKKSSRYFFEKNSQDLTDTEFALDKILETFSNIEKINIYGATGRRLDHFFANILLLNNDKYNKIKLKIIDDNNIIELAEIGKNVYYKKDDYKYFSIVPIYEDTIISIKKAKYNTKNLKLSLSGANATSNEFITDEIIVETNKKCIIIYAKD